MSLRGKLLFSYGAMLLVVLSIVVGSHVASKRWRVTADHLSRTYEQGVSAERLRWDIREMIDLGIESLRLPEEAHGRQMVDLSGQVDSLLGWMRISARESSDTDLETDHLAAFEETYRELTWIIASIQAARTEGRLGQERDRWQGRLLEINDEVDDAAAALEQFLRRRSRDHLLQAERDGQFAVIMTGLAGVLGAVQLIAMVFLVRRWVTRPISSLGRAADAIAAGRLELDLPNRPEQEWRKVATALHHMTDSLLMLQQRLRTGERLEAIGEMAAYTAHNIRNPLASIRAMTQLALTDTTCSTALRETLEDIIRCVDKMEGWVSRLLGYARPLSMQPELCDLNEIATDSHRLARQLAATRQVTLECATDSRISRTLADPSLLEQALYLILSNAIEATEPGGSVSLRLRSDHSLRTEYAIIQVEDTGAGIPGDLMERVFDPFVTTKKGGSGLGLAQAKKIIDLHLGTIDIASEVGRGTMLTIRLPIQTGV